MHRIAAALLALSGPPPSTRLVKLMPMAVPSGEQMTYCHSGPAVEQGGVPSAVHSVAVMPVLMAKPGMLSAKASNAAVGDSWLGPGAAITTWLAT